MLDLNSKKFIVEKWLLRVLNRGKTGIVKGLFIWEQDSHWIKYVNLF